MIQPIHCIALYRCIAVSCCIVVSRVEALSPRVRKYTVCIECDTTDVSRCIAPYTVIHQICDTSKTIPPCSTFWSHEHAKHSPNASTNHTKTNDNARALRMFARGQLKVLQMAVSAIGAAGPGSPDERRAWQVVLRRGQCHAAMPLRLRVAVSPRQCVVW